MSQRGSDSKRTFRLCLSKISRFSLPFSPQVKPIIQGVRERGDAHVAELTARFDGVNLAGPPCVPLSSLPAPELSPELRAAFDRAYANIRTFHAAQSAPDLHLSTEPGVRCSRVTRPLRAVGLYVPGGSAVLPSSALMLGVPAQLAGCAVRVLATPPRPDGSVAPEVLYCARLAGVTHVLRAGGAQAVAALAWGTASCPKVDKIAGPGNQWVTAAKVACQSSEALVAIDMPAGPSEVMVVADDAANPLHVALDLLSQAEHGPDSQAVLLALPGFDLESLCAHLRQQCAALPRAEVTALALRHARVLRVAGREEALRLAERYAPEHLILNLRFKGEEDVASWVDEVSAAGSVFVGPWTPESVGDYASGTNHTLPTYGYARMYSGVSLDTFQRKMTVQQLTAEGLAALGPTVAAMARCEGLHAHERAVTRRLQDMD